MKKRIYSVLVENRSGVLGKVAGLFARRCFNIDSLAVGETDDRTVSCMTIVSSGDERTIEQIEKQLNKKLDVIKVKTFAERQCITRELMLIKIKYNKNNRREIMELCEIMKAQIVDMSKHFMMIQICTVATGEDQADDQHASDHQYCGSGPDGDTGPVQVQRK